MLPEKPFGSYKKTMKPVILNPKSASYITGVADFCVPIVTERIIANNDSTVHCLIAKNTQVFEPWLNGIEFYNKLFSSDKKIKIHLLFSLQGKDVVSESKYLDHYCENLAALSTLLQPENPKTPILILTTLDGLFQKWPSVDALKKHHLHLRTKENYSYEKLIDLLGDTFSYDCEALCEAPGEYAIRGNLIDVYPYNSPTPFRIDFFGDEVESIRSFDPTTQRTLSTVESIDILGQLNKEAPLAYITDYIKSPIRWFVHEPLTLAQDNTSYFVVPEKIAPKAPNLGTLLTQRASFNDHWLGLTSLDTISPFFSKVTNLTEAKFETLQAYRPHIHYESIGHERLELEIEARQSFLKKVATWNQEGVDVYIVCHNKSEAQRLDEIIQEIPELQSLKYHRIEGDLTQGFLLKDTHLTQIFWPKKAPTEGIAIITSNEIFGRFKQSIIHHSRRSVAKHTFIDQLLDFSELVEGDYLVHLQHGICIFKGLKKIDIKGKSEEVISLEFKDEIILHLRLHESHLLSRYVGLSKLKPKLGKLGSNSWEKTRKAAETAAVDLAGQLLSLQAKRNEMPGYAFQKDTAWQKEFESSFLFKETPDQLKAIRETKGDMELSKPMDRLLCGDVGFGKTEVAIRAAFKATMDGKQVAFLVPTTVLCQQHFITFKERMAEYPIVVEMLSRFRKPAARSKIIQQASTGKIDILIGTHSLLSEELSLPKLGLLIIDEEHRFGVKHKEQLKQLKEHVDVLCMSATPIPRTLHLALVGARDLSVIETPPKDRLPIETIVKQYSPKLVKAAIQYELDRNGQVFYLHNRVQSIQAVALRLQEMLPRARIAIGHGQMDETELETIMTDFVLGKYDILVCTTIIESGLDIPNCNTIIIEGADRFGLAQLYQLRGRVGRFKRQAYAYLLLHHKSKINDQAQKRLSTLKQFNQLGAGYKISMRDLELRGAGNILGAQQSGHIAGVGFDLYCQLLKQSIAKLKGEPTANIIRAQVFLDFIIIGEKTDALPEKEASSSLINEGVHSIETLEAYIPKNYIHEPELRIDAYRKLAMACTVDEVNSLRIEFQDRYGPLPSVLQTLAEVTEIRCLAEEQGVMYVQTNGNKLQCMRASSKKQDFLKIGNRFPRLTRPTPLLKLREIKNFLKFQTQQCQ